MRDQRATSLGLFVLLITIIISDFGCTQPEKIKLSRIIFHTSRCFGSCSSQSIQIDSNRVMLLHSVHVDATPGIGIDFNPDSSRIGYFTGTISERLYTELEHELQNIQLRDLKFDGVSCCDGSVITIIVYYNGKRKFLKSMSPPAKARRLIDMLRYIGASTAVKRTKERFFIEERRFQNRE
jgi:hypothetical protein